MVRRSLFRRSRKSEQRTAVRTIGSRRLEHAKPGGTAERFERTPPGRLEQDLQSQIVRATALEQLDRGVQVNVVTHRKSAGRAWLVPGTLELFRTPPLDALDLRLVDQGDVGY